MNHPAGSLSPRPFSQTIGDALQVLSASEALAPQVDEGARILISCLKQGAKVLTCGNGGSAADAMHLAEEFVGRFRRDRRALPAICLVADPTALTCIANDYGFDQVFSRGVEALARPGDVLVAFSTSGKSANILAALKAARVHAVKTILLTGKDGGEAKHLADVSIVIPSPETARIQEVHTLVLHHWLQLVDDETWD